MSILTLISSRLQNLVQPFYTTTLTLPTHISPPHNQNHPFNLKLSLQVLSLNLIHLFLATLSHPPHSLLLHLHRLTLVLNFPLLQLQCLPPHQLFLLTHDFHWIILHTGFSSPPLILLPLSSAWSLYTLDIFSVNINLGRNLARWRFTHVNVCCLLTPTQNSIANLREESTLLGSKTFLDETNGFSRLRMKPLLPCSGARADPKLGYWHTVVGTVTTDHGIEVTVLLKPCQRTSFGFLFQKIVIGDSVSIKSKSMCLKMDWVCFQTVSR